MAYLYRHIRLDKNEPFYIGIGSDEKYKRAYSKNDRNQHWHNIVNKIEYEVEIVLDELSWEEACNKEIEFIKIYGRKDLNEGTLVNMTDGGEGNTKLSPEVNLQKGKKISQSKIGVSNNKIKGIPKTDKCKEKLRLANLGKSYSEEINKKKGLIGELNPFYNKKHSGDLKRFGVQNKGRISPNRKKIQNIDTGEIYDSLQLAAKINNIPESSMYVLVKKGIKFQYYLDIYKHE